MSRTLFVSHNFYDQKIVNLVHSMFPNSGRNVFGKAIYLKHPTRCQNHDLIGNEITQAMYQCDTALFAIGNNNRNSPWLNQEVQCAQTYALSIVLVWLPGSNGSVPNSLAGCHYPMAEWNICDIHFCLD